MAPPEVGAPPRVEVLSWLDNPPDAGHSLCLLQMDLAQHSKWVRDLDSWRESKAAKNALLDQMTAALRTEGFERMFWAGDGGVFYASVDSLAENQCVKAAKAALDTFHAWKTDIPKSGSLGLRISMHKCRVQTTMDSGNWHASELNDFIKYERFIGAKDSIGITEEVYNLLQGDEKQNWKRRWSLAVRWKLYFLRTTQKGCFPPWIEIKKILVTALCLSLLAGVALGGLLMITLWNKPAAVWFVGSSTVQNYLKCKGVDVAEFFPTGSLAGKTVLSELNTRKGVGRPPYVLAMAASNLGNIKDEGDRINTRYFRILIKEAVPITIVLGTSQNPPSENADKIFSWLGSEIRKCNPTVGGLCLTREGFEALLKPPERDSTRADTDSTYESETDSVYVAEIDSTDAPKPNSEYTSETDSENASVKDEYTLFIPSMQSGTREWIDKQWIDDNQQTDDASGIDDPMKAFDLKLWPRIDKERVFPFDNNTSGTEIATKSWAAIGSYPIGPRDDDSNAVGCCLEEESDNNDNSAKSFRVLHLCKDTPSTEECEPMVRNFYLYGICQPDSTGKCQLPIPVFEAVKGLLQSLADAGEETAKQQLKTDHWKYRTRRPPLKTDGPSPVGLTK